MNWVTAICGAAIIALALAGCERKRDASSYDPQKSAPPSAVRINEDRGLLSNQTELSQAAEKAKPAAPAAAAPAMRSAEAPAAAPATATPAPSGFGRAPAPAPATFGGFGAAAVPAPATAAPAPSTPARAPAAEPVPQTAAE